jgi:putative addiction module antidote
MVKRVTARKMGGSVGATLPKESVERFHIKAGDVLNVIEIPEGILITPFDPDFEKALEAYERGARKYRNALRELAQ